MEFWSGEVMLPESTPNPSLALLILEDYHTISYVVSGTHVVVNGSNGFNELQLKVPVEQGNQYTLPFFMKGFEDNSKSNPLHRYYASTSRIDRPPDV